MGSRAINHTHVSIGEVTELINGFPFKPVDWQENADNKALPIIRIQNLNDQSASFNFTKKTVPDKYLVKTDDLLFSWSGSIGSSFGPHIWKREVALLNQHIFRVEHKSLIDRKYFYWALKSIVAEVEEKAHGGVGLVHITKGRLQAIKIPLPPLEEQKRIAAILDTAYAIRAKRVATIAKLDELAQSVFLEMFGDPVRNEKGWTTSTLGSSTKAIQVGVVIQPASHYSDNGIIALRSLNVKKGYVSLENVVRFREESHLGVLSKSKLNKGDVVVVRTGNPGVAAIIPEELDGINCIDLLIVRPDSNKLLATFITAIMNSTAGQNRTNEGKVGVAQQHLNVGVLKEVVVPNPPISLQREYEAKMMRIDQLKSLHQFALAREESLFASLQHRAFAGEL